MANDQYAPFDTAQGLKIKEMINKRLWGAFVGLLVLIGLLATAGFFVVIRPAIESAAQGIGDAEFRAAVSQQVTSGAEFAQAVDEALQARADAAVGESVANATNNLAGMVAIFGENGCPAGPRWRPYADGAGRFIVGAGTSTDSNGASAEFQVGQAEAVVSTMVGDEPYELTLDGGEYAHFLSRGELPRQWDSDREFRFFFQANNPVPDLPEDGNLAFIGFANGATAGNIPNVGNVTDAPVVNSSPLGNGEPHNNMPPYIALHFCEYVGVGDN